MLKTVRAPLRLLTEKLPKLELPQRLRGGAIENATNYMKHVASDYKAVFLEAKQNARNRPVKATIIGGILCGLGYLMRHNPNEEDFLGQLVEHNNKLTRVPPPLRNPVAFEHIYELAKMNDERILRHQSLGFFSVIYRHNNSSDTDLFSAQCKYLRPSWKSYLTERIVDIGILNEYQLMKYKMTDYDVSPALDSKPASM